MNPQYPQQPFGNPYQQYPQQPYGNPYQQYPQQPYGNPYQPNTYTQPPNPQEKIVLNYGSFKKKEDDDIFKEVPEHQVKGKMGNVLDSKLVNLNDLGGKKK